MNEPLLVARQRTLLRDLAQRAAARARDEKLLGQTAPHAKAQAETAFENGRLDAEAKRKSALAAVERETEEERARSRRSATRNWRPRQREFDEAREATAQQCEEEKEAARRRLPGRPLDAQRCFGAQYGQGGGAAPGGREAADGHPRPTGHAPPGSRRPLGRMGGSLSSSVLEKRHGAATGTPDSACARAWPPWKSDWRTCGNA